MSTINKQKDWMNIAREWAFLTNPNIPQSLIVYLAEFGKYVEEMQEAKQ